MSRKNKKQEPQINYLDLIPIRNESLRWHRDLRERLIIEVENKGVFHRIAQKLFHKPRYTKVHLDGFGTFLWPLLDGNRTVMELAEMVKAEFGEKAEPLYPRLVKYFQIMESYGFVKFTNKPEK
jgi:hypothetical protein